MIIECKNCKKKFIVNEDDIPQSGRMVQCGSCSTEWLQIPKTSSPAPIPISSQKEKVSISDAHRASDGKDYKFLGGQWGIVLPSGKTGRLAKKSIALELNKLTDRKIPKKVTKKIKKNIDQENEDFSAFQTKKSMGPFSFLIVLAMFIVAIILFFDTFKNQITPFWPALDDYLTYISETTTNIYIITKDLFNNYK